MKALKYIGILGSESIVSAVQVVVELECEEMVIAVTAFSSLALKHLYEGLSDRLEYLAYLDSIGALLVSH